MSESNKFRDRKFVLVLYPDDLTHMAAMEKLESEGYTYVAILHDKDVYEDDGEGHVKGELKKPHWHVVLRFSPNAVWNTSVAQALGIEPNYLQCCRNLNKALTYLVHRSNPEKYQYDFEEVFGSDDLKNILHNLLTEENPGERALAIVKMIEDEPGLISPTDMFKRACKNGYYSDFLRMGQWSSIIIREHNDRIYSETFSDRSAGAFENAGQRNGFRNFVEGYEAGRKGF